MNYIMSIATKPTRSIIGTFDVTVHDGKVTNILLIYISLH